ncbi:alpha/beta fold hydrolase [Pseudomarimonas arenosa]|uniref:Alpha/beta fold hydrolase n=1 Tax=Pseudomarimonas arenosa TaxID=2774145 RepID=A0AAW3ZLN1_9GAMM|nr:alpha/beta fold hydrolase [Pseudomarimonas arenosa]MBD8526951.1 alpha/beta fold hydrolase [Pseudomarimonas arenosa]
MIRSDHPAVTPFQFGDIEVDPAHCCLRFADGRQQKLTSQCMQVLCVLAREPGELVSRAALVEQVWQGNYAVGDRGIANVIWTLRKAMEDDKETPRYIQTVPRKGYRALAAVKGLANGESSTGQAVDAITAGGDSESPHVAQSQFAVKHVERARKSLFRQLSRAVLWALLIALGLLLAAVSIRPRIALELEYGRQSWLAGAAKHEVSAGDHTWSYLEAGSGKPLLLLHSFGSRKEHWLGVIGHLAKSHRVIAPDLPGWGESERKDDSDYGYAAQSRRFAEFVAAVREGGQIDLVGHGMGGGIALVWSANGPPELDSLVLLDSLGVEYDNDLARAVRLGDNPLEAADLSSLHRRFALLFDRVPPTPWPFDQALLDVHLEQLPFERRVLPSIVLPERGAFVPGQAAYAVDVPTLVLWCQRDRVVPFSVAEDLAKRLRNQRLRALDACNHMPMIEQPANTALEIDSFL